MLIGGVLFDSERLNSVDGALFKEALLAIERRRFNGRIPASKLFRLLTAVLSPLLGTERLSILEPGEVTERKWSTGELDVELPAVDGRPLLVEARVMEGEEGKPMNMLECRLDIVPDGRSTGDPRSP